MRARATISFISRTPDSTGKKWGARYFLQETVFVEKCPEPPCVEQTKLMCSLV